MTEKLKRMRSSRKGRITATRNDFDRLKVDSSLKSSMSTKYKNLLTQLKGHSELYERIQDKILRLVGDKEDHDSHTYTQEETEESETCTFIQQLEEDIETHVETLRIYKSVCKLDRIFNNMVSSDSLSNADTLARIKEYDKEYEELLSALSEIPEHTELMDAMQSLEKLCSSIRKEALRHISSPSLPCVSDSTASTEHNSDTIRFARLELPTFSGNPSHWLRFFEDFTNGISKRHLTDSDKLQYLQRAMESEEGRAIITTGRDGGNNYDDIIHRLIERFDRPRDACRSAIADWMAHRHELSHDGIGQSLTAFETTHSILKRYTDGSLKTVLALVWEAKMHPSMYRDWRKESVKERKVPPGEKLLEFASDYRRGLLNNMDDSLSFSSSARSQSSLSKKSTSTPRTQVHSTQESSTCKACGESHHHLYQCHIFRSMSVEQRQQLQQKHKLCVNCLSSEHSGKNCSSRYTCRVCNKRHHSLLHRGDNWSKSTHGTSNVATAPGPSMDSLTTPVLAPPITVYQQPAMLSTPPFISAASPYTMQVPATPFQSLGYIPTSTSSTASVPTMLTCEPCPGQVILYATALTRVQHDGMVFEARAMLDSGSGLTFVTERFVKKARIPEHYTSLSR